MFAMSKMHDIRVCRTLSQPIHHDILWMTHQMLFQGFNTHFKAWVTGCYGCVCYIRPCLQCQKCITLEFAERYTHQALLQRTDTPALIDQYNIGIIGYESQATSATYKCSLHTFKRNKSKATLLSRIQLFPLIKHEYGFSRQSHLELFPF